MEAENLSIAGNVLTREDNYKREVFMSTVQLIAGRECKVPFDAHFRL